MDLCEGNEILDAAEARLDAIKAEQVALTMGAEFAAALYRPVRGAATLCSHSVPVGRPVSRDFRCIDCERDDDGGCESCGTVSDSPASPELRRASHE